jgi:hypothetical protein
MFPPASWTKYLVVFALAAALGSVLILFYQLRITNCSGYGYGPDTYLAQCSSKTYGDYEHGALGLQIDSQAIHHLEQAQVVILGHSHAMVAFSTSATQQYFRDRNVAIYNAALSAAYSAFFDFFLARVRLNAKVVLIDVAPFFIHEMSAAGRFIVDHPTLAVTEYRMKQLWQVIHRRGCSTAGPLTHLVCGDAFSIFRSVNDGWLIVDYTRIFGSPLPEYPVARGPHPPVENELRIEAAKRFFSRHNLDPSCTILTAVPGGHDFSDLAQIIAQAVGAPYINPSIANLTTIDRAHLDVRSATTWSRQFWKEAEPVLDRCLAKSGGRTAAQG